VPTLLIHGLADDNVLAAHSLAYYAKEFSVNPEIEFVPLVGMGHFANSEDASIAVLRREVSFLRRYL